MVPAWTESIFLGTQGPQKTIIRQYRHVVTPLVCLEMHAALMRVSGMANVMLSE